MQCERNFQGARNTLITMNLRYTVRVSARVRVIQSAIVPGDVRNQGIHGPVSKDENDRE